MRSSRASARDPRAVAAALAAIVALIGAAVPSARAAGGEPSLGSLLERFSELPGLSAKFREEKQIALLSTPVRSEGEIHFAPPGRFLRKVTSPTPSAALIEGDHLVLAADGERQEIDLSERPVVAGFVDSFRHVLAGDHEALQRAYSLDLETGQGGAWTLRLEPRSDALKQFLESLELHGERVQVERMVMREQSGDETRTTFHDVDVHPWSEARIERVFRVAP